MSHRLFTVGPVEVRDAVLNAMHRPMMTHRGKEYKDLHEGIVEKLHKALDTDLHIMMVPASATGFMEACVRNGVNDRMLGLSNGSFGTRWQGIGRANGKDVVEIDVPWGKAVKGEHIEGHLDDSIEAVTLVSNESSTGVLNDVSGIVNEVRGASDALMFIDGVTSVGGIDLGLCDLDIDALLFGTQKALALPPGLAIICASDRLMKKAAQVPNRGFYFDLLELKKKADTGYTLTTPPISIMYGLDYQLDRWLEEGSAQRYRRHREMADLVRGWAKRRLGLFAEAGHRSNTITVIEKKGIDFARMTALLLEFGYEISNGYGPIKAETFRIGHMGDLTIEDVKGLLKAMDEALEEMA